MTSAELHSEFLAELFGAFALPESVTEQLDGILTDVYLPSQSQTIDHFLTYYYFDAVSNPSIEGLSPVLYLPKIRTFYLQIEQQTWEASMDK